MSNDVERYINLEWTNSIKIVLFIFWTIFSLSLLTYFLYLKENLMNHYLNEFFVLISLWINEDILSFIFKWWFNVFFKFNY